VQDRVQVAIDH